ncbi:unnamed protein product [Adineta steineri]|uniref:KxDL domain-containing protein n=1 Tax=Adineta steineri TaxID=433720 RepID=A0A815Q5E9_9BILA|nr:unnamed protein product [Adineta steineri]CAF1458550.1 unnamed protein product [Adineta steineri]
MEENTESTISVSDTTTASSIVHLFLNETNKQDVDGLLNIQSSLLEQLDKSNEILDGINKISAKRYIDATREFTNHTQLLTTIKTDLDTIFKRIKLLKMRLNKKYPEAYSSGNRKFDNHINPNKTIFLFAVIQMSSNRHDSLDDEEDDDIVPSMKPINNPSTLVKSKTIDYTQLTSSMRETYSLAQISNTNNEQSTNSFDSVRRFAQDRSSSGGQELTTFFKNARDELRKINEGIFGSSSNNQKQSTSHEE